MMKTPRVKATIETMTKEGMKMAGKKEDFPKKIGGILIASIFKMVA